MNGAELPAGWQWLKLGALLSDLQSGFASSERNSDGIRQLRMNNVDTKGKLDWSSSIRVPADVATLDRYSLAIGDVVFNNTNSVELVGKSALIRVLDEPTTYSNHFTRLRFDDRVETRFIAGYLQRLWMARVFENGCDRWVGQAAFQKRKLIELPIPIPPPPEQRRIADAIDAATAEAEGATRAAERQAGHAADLIQIARELLFREVTEDADETDLADMCEIDGPLVDPRLPAYSCLPCVSGEHIVSGGGELLSVPSAAEQEMISGKYVFRQKAVLYSKLSVSPQGRTCSFRRSMQRRHVSTAH